MDQTKSFILTGVFVFVGIMLFGSTIYFLSGDESILSNKARVHSYFKDTQGLMFGSVVSFSGITIGNVKNITYSADKRALKVSYTIKEKFLPLIKKDSQAQLKTQGALGDRYIYISAGSNESPPVGANGEVPSKKAVDIFEVVQNKVDGIPDLSGVSKKIENLLDFLNSEDGVKGNLRELKLTLRESKTLLKDLNKDKDHKKALEKLDSIMNKIDRGNGTLGKLINDPTLYNKVLNFVGGDQGSGSYLKELGRKSIESTE